MKTKRVRGQSKKRTIQCTVCGKTRSSYRCHTLTCSDRCRQQRSRWLKAVEPEVKVTPISPAKGKEVKKARSLKGRKKRDS